MTDDKKSRDIQIEIFKETARALGCDEGKENFASALGKIVRPIAKDNEAVLGSSSDGGPVPRGLREIMKANSQALSGITKKALC